MADPSDPLGFPPNDDAEETPEVHLNGSVPDEADANAEAIRDSGAGWACSCTLRFDEPEQLQTHWTTMKNAGESETHKTVGYVDSNGDLLLKFGPYIFKSTYDWRAKLEGVPQNRKELETPEQEGQLVERKTGKGKQAQVTVAYRPSVFHMDEVVIHLYHMAMANSQRLGIDYRPSPGEWIRDTIVRHLREHPEIIDLQAMFTDEQAEKILETANG